MAQSNESGVDIGGRAWTVLHLRSVPVRVAPSLLITMALATWYFANLPALAVQSSLAQWVVAALMAVVFLGCVLAHEIGHTVTSLDRGVPVRGITLFMLGGVTESTREPRSASDELVIVGIGPFISLVLAAAFGLLFRLMDALSWSLLAVAAGYLAWINAGMAIFNLVPGYPLDGGRLLRSLLWAVTRSPHRATRWAARVGQGFATWLILGAVLRLAQVPDARLAALHPLLPTLTLFGIWGGLIGIFLWRGSSASHARALVRERLVGRRVADLMGRVPPTLPADSTLAEVVGRLQERPSVLWPVGRPLIGAIRLEDLDRVLREDWATTSAAELATTDVEIDDQTPMDEALDLLAQAPGNMLIATHDGEPVGLLTASLVVDEPV